MSAVAPSKRITPRPPRATLNWLAVPQRRVSLFQPVGGLSGMEIADSVCRVLSTRPESASYRILWDLRRHDWTLGCEDLKRCHDAYVRVKPRLPPLRFAAVSVDPSVPFLLRLAQDILRLNVIGVFPTPREAFTRLTDGADLPDDAMRFFGGP